MTRLGQSGTANDIKHALDLSPRKRERSPRWLGASGAKPQMWPALNVHLHFLVKPQSDVVNTDSKVTSCEAQIVIVGC